MANIENLIANRMAEREARQQDRVQLSEARIAMIETITAEPQAYLQYLDLQANNPQMSVGNVVLSLQQLREKNPTVLGTENQWKRLGRNILPGEVGKGANIFVKNERSGAYYMGETYDVTQTSGRVLPEPMTVADNTPEMEKALEALFSAVTVDIVTDEGLTVPAQYDPEKVELYVNTDFSDSEVFAAVADEMAMAKFHNGGYNPNYSRAEYQLDAQSVGYLVCRRFGVEHERPDASRVAELYEGWEPESKESALKAIHEQARELGNRISRDIDPQQRQQVSAKRRHPDRRPTR